MPSESRMLSRSLVAHRHHVDRMLMNTTEPRSRSNALRGALLTTLWALSACATLGRAVSTSGEVHIGRDLQESTRQAGVSSGAHDIPCSAERVGVVANEEDVGGEVAEIIVEGCGERVTYKKLCRFEAHFTCRLVLVSRVRLQP